MSKRGKIIVRQTAGYEYEARSQAKDALWYGIAYVLGGRHRECKDFARGRRARRRAAGMNRAFKRPRPRRRRAAAAPASLSCRTTSLWALP